MPNNVDALCHLILKVTRLDLPLPCVATSRGASTLRCGQEVESQKGTTSHAIYAAHD